MTFETNLRRGTTVLALTTALAATPLTAQETASGDNGNDDSDASEPADTTNADQRVASVGDTDITGADVTAFIETLPPRMRQQPPQMLTSVALQQLVLRELLLQEAMAEDLGEDPEVITLVEEAADIAREDAMVQVYLQRELEARVTDEAVQQTYDRLVEQSDQELPPLEQVRAQIERQLQQQAVQAVQQDLAADVDVIVYGPDGEPMQSDASNEDSSGSSSEEASGGTSQDSK